MAPAKNDVLICLSLLYSSRHRSTILWKREHHDAPAHRIDETASARTFQTSRWFLTFRCSKRQRRCQRRILKRHISESIRLLGPPRRSEINKKAMRSSNIWTSKTRPTRSSACRRHPEARRAGQRGVGPTDPKDTVLEEPAAAQP